MTAELRVEALHHARFRALRRFHACLRLLQERPLLIDQLVHGGLTATLERFDARIEAT
jgi:hypothetical protein